jgi:hypothetical protein
VVTAKIWGANTGEVQTQWHCPKWGLVGASRPAWGGKGAVKCRLGGAGPRNPENPKNPENDSCEFTEAGLGEVAIDKRKERTHFAEPRLLIAYGSETEVDTECSKSCTIELQEVITDHPKDSPGSSDKP